MIATVFVWSMPGGNASAPTNDCGNNWTLKMLWSDSSCVVGIVSSAQVSQEVKTKNICLDARDGALPQQVDGFPVTGRCNVIDKVLTEFVKFFLGH